MPNLGPIVSSRARHAGPVAGTTIIWLIAGILVAAAYALPFLGVLITNAQYVLFANESIAYRYFISVRILDGEGASAWLPQGQLLTLLQHGIVLWLTRVAGMSSGDIEHTLQPFGLATSAAVTALGAALLIYAINTRGFTTRDKILVSFAALVPIFVTRVSGFYYTTLPDYYFLTMVLALAYVVVFIGLERKETPIRLRTALWLGVFCGASLANKITLVSLAGIIAAQLAVLAYRDGLKPALSCVFAFSFAMVVGFFAVFFAVYLGHARDVIEVVRSWYDFGIHAGKEPGFEQFFDGLFVAYRYHLILLGFAVTLLFSTSIVATNRVHWRSRALVLGTIALMALLVFYAVYRRPAGTTLYEATVILTAQTAMLLAMLPPTFAVKGYTVLLASSALGYALFTFNFYWDKDANERSRRLAATAWQIHAATLDIGGPWVLLIPDNTYGWGGVEELILKGTSDLSWHLLPGSKTTRDRVAPGMIFRPWPDFDDDSKAFLWINKADDSGHFVENSVAQPDHRAGWAALEMRAKETDSRCQSWTPVFDHRVTLCVFATSFADRS